MSPRLTTVLLTASLALASLVHAADPAAPADAQLNPRGRAILAWFQQLQASPDLKLVSGQFAGWSGSASLGELAKIERATGRWPVMIGLDYCAWMPGNKPNMALVDVRQPNQLAREYWQAGGLVNLSWHAPNPSGASLKTNNLRLADVLKPGPLHDAWLKSMDAVAAGLQDLQSAGVVVIWRPLHEMNGGWFWWGAQEPADFIALWRHMFDYFTHTKGLHNLIWAWSPNHGQKHADLYYPGDAYADFIGLDAYTEQVNPDKIIGFDRLAGIRKPVGLTEFGPHGAALPPGDFDYRRLLDGIEKYFPQLRHFLVWNEKWNPAENRFAKEFYTDPRVITREQMPAGLAGAPATIDYVQSIETWRAGRIERLTRADGWLALIGRHPLQIGIWSVGSAAGNAIRLAAGPDHLGTITRTGDNTISFALADGVDATIDGTTGRTAPLVYGGEAKPTYVRSGTVNFYLLEAAGNFFLRVRDSESARRKNFAGIDAYPIDPAWRIEATWVPFHPPRQLPIANVLGVTQDAPCPGKAVFTHGGRTYELLPMQDDPADPLFFVLTDTTAGEETYEASRFLYADPPVNGKVILDFNKVYNPPCAFSPFTTCPLPPKENVLPFALRAGEKKYRGDAH